MEANDARDGVGEVSLAAAVTRGAGPGLSSGATRATGTVIVGVVTVRVGTSFKSSGPESRAISCSSLLFPYSSLKSSRPESGAIACGPVLFPYSRFKLSGTESGAISCSPVLFPSSCSTEGDDGGGCVGDCRVAAASCSQ